jgi:hypothetical protein
MQKLIIILLSMLALASLSISCNNKNNSSTEVEQSASLKITPPITGLETAFQEYEIDASEDQKIELENGGVISIPANSLVDAEGNLISGMVKIKYREYHDAVDALLSGIPMEYKAQGLTQTMQTAGMFEIRGEKDGQALNIAEGAGIHVKMASYESGEDYSFFHLQEDNQEGWEYLDNEYEIEVNEEKLKLKKQIQAKGNAMVFPLDAKYFSFDYSGILDVMFNNNYRQIRENRDNPAVAAKAKKYGMMWLNCRAYNNIEYKGTTQPAAMMLWKRLNGRQFPAWMKDDQLDHTSLEKQYGNVYKLTVEDQKSEEVYTATIQAIMPLNALFKFSPEYWENNYKAAMAKVEAEMERLKKEADVFRSFEVSGFGIYNYDKFLKIEDRIDVLAKFEVEEAVKAENEVYELDLVYCLTEDNKTVIKLPKEDWGKVALIPGNKARFMSILPGGKIGIYSAEKYMALDFEGLRKKDEPEVEFVLVNEIQKLSSADELKSVLNI